MTEQEVQAEEPATPEVEEDAPATEEPKAEPEEEGESVA